MIVIKTMLLRFYFLNLRFLWLIQIQAHMFIDKEIWFLSISFDGLIEFSSFDLLLQVCIKSLIVERACFGKKS